MKAKVANFVLLLHLVMPPIVKTEMCTCPSENDYDSSSCLREALQAKLTSTPTNIQKLQNMFYSSNNVQRYIIYTNMTVSVSLSGEYFPLQNSAIDQFSWTHVWYEDNFAGVIRELIPTRFQVTDPIAAFLNIYTFLDLLAPRDTYYYPQLNIQLNCVSRGESTQVSEKELKNIWEHILQWVSTEAHKRCMPCKIIYLINTSPSASVPC